MATMTVGQITIAYHGKTHRFKTVRLATQFLRQPQIQVGGLHMLTATVLLLVPGKMSQTRYFKGGKYRMIKELTQLESDLKRSYV